MHKSPSQYNLSTPFDIESRERKPGQDRLVFLYIMQEQRVFIKENSISAAGLDL